MTRDGTGTLRILLLPRNPNSSGNPQMGLPSVYMKAAPRTIVMSASVTMKGVILNLVMKTPAMEPESTPASNPHTIAAENARAGGSGDFNTLGATTPLNATSAPTERSIPAVRITNVIPTAMIAVIDVWRETFRMLSAVKKEGESCEKRSISARRAMPIPNSPVIFAKSLPGVPALTSSGIRYLMALPGRERHDFFLCRFGAGENSGKPPLAHDGDPVGNAQNLGKVRGNNDYTDSLFDEAVDEIVDLILHTDIDARGGFVEDQQFALRVEPSGEHHLLPVSPAQVFDFLFDGRRFDLQLIGILPGDSRLLFPVDKGAGEQLPKIRKRNILPDAHLHDEAILVSVLGQEAYPQIDRLSGRLWIDLLSFQNDFPLALPISTEEHPGELRPAGPDQSRKPEYFPPVNREVDILKNPPVKMFHAE